MTTSTDTAARILAAAGVAAELTDASADVLVPTGTPYTAPPVPVMLGRTRRSIDLLSRSRIATTDQLTLASAVDLVPAVVSRMLRAEVLKPGQRSGRRYLEAAVYEYTWQFFPTSATAVSAAFRSWGQQAALSDDDERAHVGALQAIFSPRDPRLAWQAADGTLVMDELGFSFHSGSDAQTLRRRLLADLTLGHAIAAAHDRPFGGVRVLALRRPAWHALLVTASDPEDPDTLRSVPLEDSALSPAGPLLPAGVNR